MELVGICYFFIASTSVNVTQLKTELNFFAVLLSKPQAVHKFPSTCQNFKKRLNHKISVCFTMCLVFKSCADETVLFKMTWMRREVISEIFSTCFIAKSKTITTIPSLLLNDKFYRLSRFATLLFSPVSLERIHLNYTSIMAAKYDRNGH